MAATLGAGHARSRGHRYDEHVLNATRTSLQEAMRKVDEARRCNPVANDPTSEPRPLGNRAEENADNLW
jgi:hypothetical protein